jgi:hypothetical protein
MPGSFDTTRFDYLRECESRLDAHKAAAVFNEYIAVQQQQGGGQDQQQTPPGLDPFVQPPPVGDTGDGMPPASQTEQRVYTGKEVSDFYQAKIRGDYKGREEEAARIEADINLAAAQGRIVSG